MPVHEFTSKYCTSKSFITAAQYLAERICERKAAKDKQTLPAKFWNNEAWRAEFTFQVVNANRLLRSFSVEAILNALKNPKSKYMISLGPKSGIRNLIKLEQLKLDSAPKQEVTVQAPPVASPVYTVPPPSFTTGQSTQSKLQDL